MTPRRSAQHLANLKVKEAPPTKPVGLAKPRGGIVRDDYTPANPTSYPNSVNGKLFLKTGDGQLGSCSASVITAPGKSLIVTAGHCLYSPASGGWSSDVVFVPAYENRAAPFGMFIGARAAVPSRWISSNATDLTADFGVVALDPNVDGTRVMNVVGSWGYLFNAPPNRGFHVVGYPADPPPYDGQAMVACDTSFFGYDAQSGGDGSFGVQPCTQGDGSTGAPYVTPTGYAQAVYSHSYCLDGVGVNCGVIFGTYFGPTAKNTYELLARAAPAPAAPKTFLRRAPAHRTRSRSPRFSFTSNVPGARFNCLYADGWGRCKSPVRFRHVAPGRYTFKVRARAYGRKDRTPAAWRWRVLG